MILILKPTLACNLRCKYCYLSNESKKAEVFDIQFAKTVLRQAKDTLLPDNKRQLKILWHGGEPLLWGIKNYTEIFDFIENEFDGYNYHNSIQTNLSLLNDEFINLFVKHRVGVGCSLDGPKEIHDSQRMTMDGKGTFDSIMTNVERCREKGLNVGCIVVGTRKHIGKIPQLYRFLSENNIGFKFNPIFNGGEAKKHIDEYGLSPKEYAAMFIELFDLWLFDNEHKLKNTVFVDIASSIISQKGCSLCAFNKNCQHSIIAVSPNGDVVPCGRFCDNELKKYAYGNLHRESLKSILEKIEISDTYKRYERIIDSSCNKCKYLNICYGGCLYDGYMNSGDFKSKTFLCSAYKMIFAHIEGRMTELKNNSTQNKK